MGLGHKGQVGHSHTDRAVSEVVGYVILIVMVVSVTGTIIMFAGGLVGDLTGELESDRAEKSLQQLNSEASVVALGSDTTGQSELPGPDGGSYRIIEDAGRVNISATNVTSGDVTVLRDTSFGTVVYQNGDNEVAYQGGGVWRKAHTGSNMVSPPEFSYRDGTLTFPIIKVTGSSRISDTVTITDQSSSGVFPNQSLAGDIDGGNPIRGHNLTVTIQSEYYRGWGEYFEQRTDTVPTFDHDKNTVTATLVPPPTPITADSAITGTGNVTVTGAATVDGDVTLGGTFYDPNGNNPVTGTVRDGVNAAGGLESADSVLQSAENRLSGQNAPGSNVVVTAGEYHMNTNSLFDQNPNQPVTFDTTGGDIELYVDSDVVTETDLYIQGENDVRLYVDGEFHMSGNNYKWGDSNSVDQFTVYSRSVDRITDLYGILYTGAVDIRGSGSGIGLRGSLISTTDDVDLGGNVDVTYDPVLADTVLDEVNTPLATITYLHISEHTISLD
jgi:flagellin-like protein